jgi:hypothetical protein
MKERLTMIFNALMQMEVKGRNVVIVADVLRELESIINAPEEPEPEAEEEEC